MRSLKTCQNYESISLLGIPLSRHITVEEATEMGLPVNVELPRSIYELMDLYPQPQGGRPTVQYIPMPYDDRHPILPTPKGRPMEEPNQKS